MNFAKYLPILVNRFNKNKILGFKNIDKNVFDDFN